MSRRLSVVVTILVLALVPALSAGAQEAADTSSEQPSGDGLRFLVRAGATGSVLRGGLQVEELGSVSFDPGYGFAAAVGVDVPVGERVSLQGELVIVRRLTRLDLPDDGPRSKLSVNYLEIPVMLKWYPGGKSGNRVHLDAGPVPALRLGASREVREDGAIRDVASKDLFERLDWSLGLGVGFEFPELFVHFTVDIRYLHGLGAANAVPGERDARWSSLQTMIGVAF